jgi:hypothetical protein
MRIEDTPIRDISDGTFDGSFAESLEELYIINTWLTRVSPAIKVSLSPYTLRVKLELNYLRYMCIISFFLLIDNFSEFNKP